MKGFFKDITKGSIDIETLREQKDILINWVMEKGGADDEIDQDQAKVMDGLIDMLFHMQEELSVKYGEDAVFGKGEW